MPDPTDLIRRSDSAKRKRRKRADDAEARIERYAAALREIATDPRDDSVCIGDGWGFYTDAVNYARAALENGE